MRLDSLQRLLHADALATLRTAGRQNLTATLRGHASTETVDLGPLTSVRLIGALHMISFRSQKNNSLIIYRPKPSSRRKKEKTSSSKFNKKMSQNQVKRREPGSKPSFKTLKYHLKRTESFPYSPPSPSYSLQSAEREFSTKTSVLLIDVRAKVISFLTYFCPPPGIFPPSKKSLLWKMLKTRKSLMRRCGNTKNKILSSSK